MPWKDDKLYQFYSRYGHALEIIDSPDIATFGSHVRRHVPR